MVGESTAARLSAGWREPHACGSSYPRRTIAAVALPAEPLLDGFLTSLVGDPRLVHVEHLPARTARYGALASPLPEAVGERLGVERFWSHQAQAIDHLRAGRSVAVSSGTASGKSLCFQAPIAEAVTTGLRPATSLLLFPTKALAQDQLRAITALDVGGLVAATYDGDCSPEERTWARAHANVVLTNPEMLHVGLLPHHARWATFFLRLRFVVVDELHTLRGIFGSHVAHLLRRLRRICAHYGSHPSFVFTSATIGEPARLAAELCGLPVEEVTDDGSPRGERTFVLWDPAGGEAEGGRSVSSARDSAELMSALVTGGHRTIAFCRSRKGTELVAADVKRRLRTDLADSVPPLPGGLPLRRTARDRTEAVQWVAPGGGGHHRPRSLGIDVGGLDACVLNGFPGTIASMWQQAGRAGRGTQASIAALVAGDDQLDQWFHAPSHRAVHPSPRDGSGEPEATPTCCCPTWPVPPTSSRSPPRDDQFWPDLLDDGVRRLVLDDVLKLRPPSHRRGTSAVWAGRGWPSRGGRAPPCRRRGVPHRHRRRRPDRHRGRFESFPAGAPGGRLPPPGAGVAGHRPRPRRPGGSGRAVRRG